MSHWKRFHETWSNLGPPLRPHADVVRKVVECVGSQTRSLLLLGVTPEYALAFDHVDAIDSNAAMIAALWPGDTAGRRAMLGNWLDIEGDEPRYSAILGDGSLNAIGYPDDWRNLLARLSARLDPDGVVVLRIFECPDIPFQLADLTAVVEATPAPVNFNAFKWMMATHLAAQRGPDVPVMTIRALFDRLCPDRDRLSRMTGWTPEAINTIELYRDSPAVYSFPNRQQILAALPDDAVEITFHASGDYDLAACCPILSFRKRRG